MESELTTAIEKAFAMAERQLMKSPPDSLFQELATHLFGDDQANWQK